MCQEKDGLAMVNYNMPNSLWYISHSHRVSSSSSFLCNHWNKHAMQTHPKLHVYRTGETAVGERQCSHHIQRKLPAHMLNVAISPQWPERSQKSAGWYASLPDVHHCTVVYIGDSPGLYIWCIQETQSGHSQTSKYGQLYLMQWIFCFCY